MADLADLMGKVMGNGALVPLPITSLIWLSNELLFDRPASSERDLVVLSRALDATVVSRGATRPAPRSR
jgi:hypothetical protein